MSDIDTAVVLAGGFGTRLSSVVGTKPKMLAPVSGKPFLSYILDQIHSFNLKKIVLCTGYLHNQLIDYYGHEYRSIPITYCHETVALGTGGAVRNTLPWLSEGPFLIMNGDSYCDFDFIEFEVFHSVTNAEVSMLLVEERQNHRGGLVTMGDDDKVISFKEKEASVMTSLVNAGIYIMNKTVIRSIPVKTPCSLENDFFPTIINKSLYGMVTGNPMIDIGTPESYSSAQTFFSGQ